MSYGVPYQGSKSRIAKDIIEQLPTGKRFVDLFAGGCAMTHAAILSQKYEKFLCNDLYPHGVNLFKNALNGEYSKPEYLRWVSREEFFAKKDTDDFVKLCYSFGSGGNTYMYSKKLEPLKKGFHYAVVFDDWTYLEQYAKANNWREGLIDELKKSVEGISDLEQKRWEFGRHLRTEGIMGQNDRVLQNMSAKKRLDEINERRLKLTKPAFNNRIITLEQLIRLNNIEQQSEFGIVFTSSDYRDYLHEEGDVVYCDPPYAGVKGYDGREFNHEEFWEWVRTRDYPIYVSEYNAPDDFACIWQREVSRLCAGGKSAHQKAIEHLYIHSKWRNEE